MTRKKANQIYIISCGDLLKIGVTNDIDKRIKNLQTGNPKPLTLEFVQEKNNPYKVENYLHIRLQKHRIKGEWFEGITVHDIRVQLMLCTEYD